MIVGIRGRHNKKVERVAMFENKNEEKKKEEINKNGRIGQRGNL